MWESRVWGSSVSVGIERVGIVCDCGECECECGEYNCECGNQV